MASRSCSLNWGTAIIFPVSNASRQNSESFLPVRSAHFCILTFSSSGQRTRRRQVLLDFLFLFSLSVLGFIFACLLGHPSWWERSDYGSPPSVTAKGASAVCGYKLTSCNVTDRIPTHILWFASITCSSCLLRMPIIHFITDGSEYRD